MTAGCHRIQLKPEGREPKAGLGAVYAKGPDGFAITVEPGAHGLGPRGSVWHCAGPSGEELNVMENTNGQVRRRGPERILVAATLAAVAMLGCSDDNGGNLNPTAPSAVNAPPTASSASTASLVSAVATPTSAGAEAASSGDQITVDSSMTSTRGLNAATTRTPLTANFVLVPSDHDGSPFAVQLHFSEPIDNKPRHVKQAFSVIGGTTGGSVTKAKRLNPQWLSGKRVASQWELTVTPSGAGDVVLAVPGGRSCSAGSALCTPARQSLSHDLSATIRDGTASGQVGRPGQTSIPGRVRDLRVEYRGSGAYHVSWRQPFEGPALKYHVLVGGCRPGSRILIHTGWSSDFFRVVFAGSELHNLATIGVCTPARQSLSHDLSATIRDGTASGQVGRPGQTSIPGRVRDLRVEYRGRCLPRLLAAAV